MVKTWYQSYHDSWIQRGSAIRLCQPLSTKAGTPYYVAPQVTGWLRPGGHGILGGLLGNFVNNLQKQVKLHDDWCLWLVEPMHLQVPFHYTDCTVAHRLRISRETVETAHFDDVISEVRPERSEFLHFQFMFQWFPHGARVARLHFCRSSPISCCIWFHPAACEP